MHLLKRILSQFTYVHKLRKAVGAAYAMADMINIHSKDCCENKCVNKMAARFVLQYGEFEDLAYNKDEWEEWDIYGNNYLG